MFKIYEVNAGTLNICNIRPKGKKYETIEEALAALEKYVNSPTCSSYRKSRQYCIQQYEGVYEAKIVKLINAEKKAVLTEDNGKIIKEGVTGWCGPNDGGYIHNCCVNAAKEIQNAQELFSQGHYPHSNAKIIPVDHPLRIIMEQLEILDEKYAFFANKKPDKTLFSTYTPPYEDTIR